MFHPCESKSVAPSFEPLLSYIHPHIIHFVAVTRMEELARLEASRKAYKSHVTRVFNKVDKIFNQESLDKLSAAHLPIAINQLTNKLETFKQIDDRIANLIKVP